MKSWSSPAVPTLPGTGPTPEVHDVLDDEVRPVRPIEGRVSLYVCGVTPYDTTHMGHAATYVTFDLLHRALLDAGLPVDYVQNVTDVDDPLLERAARDGVDWRDLAVKMRGRVSQHGVRRSAEMREAAEMVGALGLDDSVCSGIADVQAAYAGK